MKLQYIAAFKFFFFHLVKETRKFPTIREAAKQRRGGKNQRFLPPEPLCGPSWINSFIRHDIFGREQVTSGYRETFPRFHLAGARMDGWIGGRVIGALNPAEVNERETVPSCVCHFVSPSLHPPAKNGVCVCVCE